MSCLKFKITAYYPFDVCGLPLAKLQAHQPQVHRLSKKKETAVIIVCWLMCLLLKILPGMQHNLSQSLTNTNHMKSTK